MIRPVSFLSTISLSIPLLLTAAASAQTENVLYAFQSGSPTDGANPGTIVMNSKGSFYGTTNIGGANNYGTVFKLSPPAGGKDTWNETILYSFTGGADSGNPSGPLLLEEKSGKFYGATSCTCGSAVFELTPPSEAGSPWAESVIYNSPVGVTDLISDPKGRLYGLTLTGGTHNAGSAFVLYQAGGVWTEQLLYSFPPYFGKSSTPNGMVLTQGGVIYGNTVFGGGTGYDGTIWSLTPPTGRGTGWKESTVYGFPSDFSLGAWPEGKLIFDSSGNIYGTVIVGVGGVSGSGGVFQLVPPSVAGGSWTENVLYAFQDQGDGSGPSAGVIFDSAGALYGTTANAGDFSCGYFGTDNGCGTVFKLIPPSTAGVPWTEETLHAFTGGTDGINYGSATPLLIDGTLYDTTLIGGDPNVCLTGRSVGCGTVFDVVQ